MAGTLTCARTGWAAGMPAAPGQRGARVFRDTTREQGPGDGFRGPGSVRSAVVSDAREPGSGETRELVTMVTLGVAVAAGKAGR
jgi:hypothetical protein